ncbi:MAG: hypothetical protein IPF92_14165 [Myxococcales bacterium]|nr:hypothetical protein [Myxococcales bacterium]MBL0195023.1 hypothetical protein [Myxococcales bacterium]HQY61758.1 hypothetical protein [Polyangiaceae bacterium]
MNPTNCPTCSAPLEPVATRCAYCGAVTEVGRAEAARVEHEARAREAHARAASLAQASMAQAIAADDVRRSARNALLWSGFGMALCCAPSTWVGAFFAWRSLSVAKKHGIPRATSAIFALVLSVLGTGLSVTTCVAFQLDQSAKEDRRAAAEARALAGRTRPVLDAKTACDLAEAHLLSHETPTMTTSAELSCKGPLVATSDVARLAGVTVMESSKTTTYRACFARGARWYVLDLAGSGECGRDAPKADTPADEKRARQEFASRIATLTKRGVEERLASARDAVAQASLTLETACGETLPPTTRATVRAIDYAVLDGKPEAAFAFLSDPDLVTFVARGSTATTKARLAAELEGEGLLVVYRHKTRSAPEVTERGTGLELAPGDYEGAAFVVDLNRGEIACQTALRWRGPESSTFRLARERTRRTSEQMRANTAFREAFQDAATERLKRLARARIKLGYKPLE